SRHAVMNIGFGKIRDPCRIFSGHLDRSSFILSAATSFTKQPAPPGLQLPQHPDTRATLLSVQIVFFNLLTTHAITFSTTTQPYLSVDQSETQYPLHAVLLYG